MNKKKKLQQKDRISPRYHYLKKGDLIEAGDEFFETGRWYIVHAGASMVGEKVKACDTIRREIT